MTSVFLYTGRAQMMLVADGSEADSSVQAVMIWKEKKAGLS